MAKQRQNAGKLWKPAEIKQLRALAKGNTPTPVIAIKLQRTESSIRSKAQAERVSLKPTNKSPYGTRRR